jgi:hypothetical protein
MSENSPDVMVAREQAGACAGQAEEEEQHNDDQATESDSASG